MSGYLVLILFLSLVLMGVPVAFSFLIPSIIYILYDGAAITILATKITSSANSFTMIAIPLFIYAGCLMNYSGVSDYLLRFCKMIVGRFKGALAYCNVLTSLIFAGTSGSALADIGGIGKVVMYAMKNDGYSDEDSIGITAASSTIGPIFPPSIPLMIYAIAADQSSSDLLVAGILPALLIVVVLCIYIACISRKHNFPKSKINYSAKEKATTLAKSLPAMMIPIILITGLMLGKFGATALAAVSCILTILLGAFFYKGLSWSKFIKASKEALRTSGNILFVISSAGIFAWVLTVSHVTQDLARLFMSISSSKPLVMLFIVIFLSIIGLFIDASPAILISAPILLPVATTVGISPIQLGVVMILTLMIGLLTPPVGMSLYMLSDVAQTPLQKIVKSIGPYYIVLYAVLLMVMYIPSLTTWIPSLF